MLLILFCDIKKNVILSPSGILRKKVIKICLCTCKGCAEEIKKTEDLGCQVDPSRQRRNLTK